MERPSHIIIPTSHRYRLPLLALAASIQIGVAWLFMHGLATSIKNSFHDIIVSDIKEPVKPRAEPPPPPKVPQKITIPTSALPPYTVDTATVLRNTDSEIPTTGGGTTVTPPTMPDRLAVSIASTHTTPPYPVVARRTGAEGNVTLRLTVAPTGRVSAAEVVASSGSDDLDQAARKWILAHWAYRPALDHGQPVASQTQATMTFNLKDVR